MNTVPTRQFLASIRALDCHRLTWLRRTLSMLENAGGPCRPAHLLIVVTSAGGAARQQQPRLRFCRLGHIDVLVSRRRLH
jgi:hypothetical protein